MARAVWNGAVIAESGSTRVVEGNHYFPPDSIDTAHLQPSDKETYCGWKGQASYYDIEAGGDRLPNAAWYYPDPQPAAEAITGYVAFARGVDIEDAERRGPLAAIGRLLRG
jgi:uncharacterized protein (DUF427 family)